MSTRTEMSRSEVTKKIKQDLKQRTNRTWSVSGHRGTGWGWLTIEAPKARRVDHKTNPKFDQTKLSYEQTELPWIECEPEEGQEGYYTSQEDREILAEALGIGMNLSSHQGVSISPDSWDFYMDRAENGPPPPEPVEEPELPEWVLVPTPEAPEDVELEEVSKDIFEDAKFPKLNKNSHIQEYTGQLDNPDDYYLQRAKVTHIARLTDEQYDALVNGNLLTDIEWLAGKGGSGSTADLRDVDAFGEYTEEEQEAWREQVYNLSIKVVAPDRPTIYIDPQGCRYARYVGFSVSKEQEPELETATDNNNEVFVNLARTFLETKPPGDVLNILTGSGLDTIKALKIMAAAV